MSIILIVKYNTKYKKKLIIKYYFKKIINSIILKLNWI